jgi:uracil-DNA glycosylase
LCRFWPICHLPMRTNPSKKPVGEPPSPGADDLYRRLEERAIAESNDLNRRVSQCRLCRRNEFLPTVGSGHPLADIFLLKYQPHYLEVSEGVSFFGRAGAAVLRSVVRLELDPLLLYGTNAVKCANVDLDECEANCPAYMLEELQITRPKMVVVMGERALRVLNQNLTAGMRELAYCPGEVQEFTPFCRALVTPDVDESLDEKTAKVAFWQAFRALGDWYRDEPPY